MAEGLGLIRHHDPGSKNSQWRAGYARRVGTVYQDALFHPSLQHREDTVGQSMTAWPHPLVDDKPFVQSRVLEICHAA